MDMYIVLAITLFMMIMFVWNKVPFGVTTMTCCVLLAIFGIVDIQQAFGGFGNKIVVLIAPMLVMSSALGKTGMVIKISSVMNSVKGKRGMVLIFAFYAVGIVMAQFIPTTAAISIIVIFLLTLDSTGEITPKRLLLPLLGVMCACKFRFPVGMGATTFATLNGMYEGIMGDRPEYMLQMLDPFKVAIIPMVVLVSYCLAAWKLMPKEKGINQEALKKTSMEKQLTDRQEIIVYIVFIAVMLMMLLNKYTGNMLYLAPAAGVLVLIYTKVVSVQEAVKGLSADMIWMLAGVLVVADALGATGAGDAIGNVILGILGKNPSSVTVMFVFSFATVIMTTFLSNMATQSVLVPIAASVALTAGWDPRGLILIIGTCNYYALGFPSGSGEAAVCFAAGGYNPFKVLKFTLPYMILAAVSTAISAQLLFPLY